MFIHEQEDKYKMNSTTQISTTEARRISKRLINHWKHKFEVAETENDSKIFMQPQQSRLAHMNSIWMSWLKISSKMLLV